MTLRPVTTRQKVLVVMGTRPEVIKLAPVVQELQEHPHTFETRLCVTGQHRGMLDQMLDVFELSPDHDLDVMQPRQSPSAVASSVLSGMERVIRLERPEWILVQGDTTTVMAASIAAFHEKVHLGHVEAGLRTWKRYSPFPEEGNRLITTALTELHFAPTRWAAENLHAEGIPPESIVVTGNTVIDALKFTLSRKLGSRSTELEQVVLANSDKRLALVTTHRRENHGQRLEEICAGLRDVSRRLQDIHLILPVHPNPRVTEPVQRLLGDLDNVSLISPLDYPSVVWLLDRCSCVITDSGGLQEEASGLGKPVLVLRDATERPEAVEAGLAQLVGADRQRISEGVEEIFAGSTFRANGARSIYGDGMAARRIISSLATHRADLEARRELAQVPPLPIPIPSPRRRTRSGAVDPLPMEAALRG